MTTHTPDPIPLEAVARIVGGGLINTQSSAHGGGYVVIGLDMKRAAGPFDEWSDAHDALCKIKAAAILSHLRPAVVGEAVGATVAMPGSNGGFTMATFKASDVPVGTPLYTTPATHDALIARVRSNLATAQGLLIEAQEALIGRDDVCMAEDGSDAIAVWREEARALLADLDAEAWR